MENKFKWENLHKQSRFRPKYPNELVVQYVFRNFNRDGKNKILDLGCGAGRHVFFMGCENIVPYGLDISQPGVDYTRQLLSDSGMKDYCKNIVCADFQSIPFECNFFDGIISFGSLYYSDLSGIKKAIDEMHRILKPGGKILIVVRGFQDYRYGAGETIEKNTFIIRYDNEKACANAENGMIMHFFDKAELYELFKEFTTITIEETFETSNNGKLVDFNYIVNVVK